jgi:hypothetical protein
MECSKNKATPPHHFLITKAGLPQIIAREVLIHKLLNKKGGDMMGDITYGDMFLRFIFYFPPVG